MYEALRLDQSQRWQSGERVRIDAYLQRFPGLRDEPAALVDLIYGEIVLREKAGERFDRNEYIARFPSCAAELRRQFAICDGTQLSQRDEQTAVAPPSVAPQVTVAPQDTGRIFETISCEPLGELAEAAQQVQIDGPKIPGFEILSELGRGGMGVVYRARQISADRLVALKVVRNDVLDMMPLASRSTTLERFKHEAQAAARLEHDNLVTVYEVGQSGGMSYYAMRYVEGKNLHEMLADGPLDNRRAARYVEPVARALQSAHQRGILHRDIKPHNIIVDERSDRPLLTDFGLAKFVERRDELTHAGDVMGTPSYMPPEQTRDAKTVTAASDVYSLGATLYHVLTARPPFQAANIGETLRQIVYEEPVAPRRLNPAIDQDLETICLKCLQKEPARRYASAELLADDLERYLQGRPIIARPLSPPERLWRWCLRNPILAGMSATAVALAAVALLATTIGYLYTAAALAKSESRLQKALQVVDELFTRVSEDELLNEPGMQPLRKDLLARALKHYQYFLAESGDNAKLRDEVAAARFRVGLITQLIGPRAAALEELNGARIMQTELLATSPANVARLKALADTVNALGNLQKEQRSLDEAAAQYAEAIALRERLTKLEPGNREFQRLLANARMNLALVALERSLPDEAQAQMQQAQEARHKLLAADTNSTKLQRDVAMGYYNLATLSLAQNQPAAASEQFKQAIKYFERLQTAEARSLTNRYYLAICYRMLGGLQSAANALEDASSNYEASQQHIAALAAGNPEVAVYRAELALLAMNRGALYEDLNDMTAALAAWSQAHDTLRELEKREPANQDYPRDLAVTLSALGSIHLRRGEFAQANERLSAASAQLKMLLAKFPDDALLKQQLDDTLADLAACAAAKKDAK